MAKVKLTDLVKDFTVYPRNEISSQNVQAIMDAIEMGDPIPPIVAEQKTKRIVDGFHRYDAYQKLKIDTVDVTWRTYKNDAELFADAYRLNGKHGRQFDQYDIKRAVLKLTDFGLKPHQISNIVRIPKGRIDEFIGAFGKGPRNSDIVLKAGLAHELKGRTLTKEQVEVNEKWGGYQPAYHVNQLIRILEAGIVPSSTNFHAGMDQLVQLWLGLKKQKVTTSTVQPQPTM